MLRARALRVVLTLAGLAVPAAASRPCAAQTPEEFYAKQTVNLVVGLEAGGGYDAYARLLARHLGRHLNGAAVVVQNMTGAGSLRAVNYVYNVAPSNGTVLATFVSGIAFEPLFGNQAALFKATDFTWVGSINAEVSTCQAWHSAPVQRFEDLFTKVLVVGGTGTGADSNLFPQVLNTFLQTKLKLVSGYPGAAPIFLAIERGELQGICGIYWSSVVATRGDWIRDGKLRPLVQLAIDRHPDHPDIPLALDFAKTPEDRQAMELIFAPMKFARPFLGPPGVPADRLAYLRRAFNDTVNDPAFRAEAEKMRLDVGPMTGQEIESLLARLFATPSNVIERARAARN